MRCSSQVKPISYLKANAAEVLAHLAEQREPLVITQNGEARAVLQDIASFEETQETQALLIKADGGDAVAQAEIGTVFHRFGNARTAVYWWQLAAAQGVADAMQWLGRCHAAGEGVERDENLALMWISKAAAAGHAIAGAQLQGLLHQRAAPQ